MWGFLCHPPGSVLPVFHSARVSCACTAVHPQRGSRVGIAGSLCAAWGLSVLSQHARVGKQVLRFRRPPSARSSQVPTCCAGWRQQGDECAIGEWASPGGATWGAGRGRSWQLGSVWSAAVCEGNSTCSENEVCVRPGECRCRHGYFGANCDTSEHGAGAGRGVGVLERGGEASEGREDGSGLGQVASGWVRGGACSCISSPGLSSPAPQSARASSGVLTARSCAVATHTGSART